MKNLLLKSASRRRFRLKMPALSEGIVVKGSITLQGRKVALRLALTAGRCRTRMRRSGRTGGPARASLALALALAARCAAAPPPPQVPRGAAGAPACRRSTATSISGAPYALVALDATALCAVHDPSIVEEAGVLYVFGTDAGAPPAPPMLRVRRSADNGSSWTVSYTHLTLPTNREV